MKCSFIKLILCFLFIVAVKPMLSQDSQTQTQLKVKQLIEKKAEYHHLTGGEQDGYHIKIHFGADKDKMRGVKSKFQQRFSDITTYEEYQQPNWVVLVGDYKTKLEAFQILKKIQGDFPTSFIVKGKIKMK